MKERKKERKEGRKEGREGGRKERMEEGRETNFKKEKQYISECIYWTKASVKTQCNTQNTCKTRR